MTSFRRGFKEGRVNVSEASILKMTKYLFDIEISYRIRGNIEIFDIPVSTFW